MHREADYTVLITTSGIGSRLGYLTNSTNKSLVLVGDKPAIAHVIESYPKESSFVITLGHYGHHVKQFLEIAFPEHYFEFVGVNPFEGPGSSLAYSLFSAKNFLQKPFIYHACDTLILHDLVPPPTENWIGGKQCANSSHYASFNVRDNQVIQMHDKGEDYYDYVHIGLVGINSFAEFWEALEELLQSKKGDEDFSDVNVIRKMLDVGIEFSLRDMPGWHDIGNIDSLQEVNSRLPRRFYTLPKLGESIYFHDEKVIKFFSHSSMCKNIVQRSQRLGGLVPPIIDNSDHFFSYHFVNGTPLSKSKDTSRVVEFLDWCHVNLWLGSPKIDDKFKTSICSAFYFEKTIKRLEEFLRSRSVSDVEIVINGTITPPAHQLVKDSMDLVMQNIKATRIHGDLVLDNVLDLNDTFKLIDWRESFGGQLDWGDLYYDLAKFNHSLVINHEVVKNSGFEIRVIDSAVTVDVLVKATSVSAQVSFYDWAKSKGLNLKKVRLLTGIVWLNMAPLHHHPFDLFLYYWGRKMLNEEIGRDNFR